MDQDPRPYTEVYFPDEFARARDITARLVIRAFEEKQGTEELRFALGNYAITCHLYGESNQEYKQKLAHGLFVVGASPVQAVMVANQLATESDMRSYAFEKRHLHHLNGTYGYTPGRFVRRDFIATILGLEEAGN